MNMTNEIIVTAKAKAFSAEGVREHDFLVELGDYPRVRVWDSVGNIYTVCHSLSKSAERRILKLAAAKLACSA
jgi:hypothetical protein